VCLILALADEHGETRVLVLPITRTASFHLLERAAMGVMGRAFFNPKANLYRARLVLARHLFVILCQE
jgi:hypothetical protein